MIIIDLNQVMISNIMQQLGNHTNATLEENMVRHMVLNSLLSYKKKFSSEYGELVIACDNKNVWRKKVFPYYKANRKKVKENSDTDWKSIFECLSNIREELKTFFPYKVVDVESAEADDVIATITRNSDEKTLILSGDKDFIQLHSKNVDQYDPVRKKFIKHDNPRTFLFEHILKGDSGDGIPNILSNDDVFISGTRQKPMTAKRIKNYMETPLAEMDNESRRNFQRNEMLIDLKFTPKEIQDMILDQFNSQKKDKSQLMNYFIKNKLKNLMEHIGEF